MSEHQNKSSKSSQGSFFNKIFNKITTTLDKTLHSNSKGSDQTAVNQSNSSSVLVSDKSTPKAKLSSNSSNSSNKVSSSNISRISQRRQYRPNVTSTTNNITTKVRSNSTALSTNSTTQSSNTTSNATVQSGNITSKTLVQSSNITSKTTVKSRNLKGNTSNSSTKSTISSEYNSSAKAIATKNSNLTTDINITTTEELATNSILTISNLDNFIPSHSLNLTLSNITVNTTNSQESVLSKPISPTTANQSVVGSSSVQNLENTNTIYSSDSNTTNINTTNSTNKTNKTKTSTSTVTKKPQVSISPPNLFTDPSFAGYDFTEKKGKKDKVSKEEKTTKLEVTSIATESINESINKATITSKEFISSDQATNQSSAKNTNISAIQSTVISNSSTNSSSNSSIKSKIKVATVTPPNLFTDPAFSGFDFSTPKSKKSKVEAKSEAKVESKLETTTNTKVVSKAETKVETTTNSKVETKSESITNNVTVESTSTKGSVAVKVQKSVAPPNLFTDPAFSGFDFITPKSKKVKAEAKSETKTEDKVATKVETKPEANVESKVESKLETTTNSKVETKTVSTTNNVSVESVITKYPVSVDKQPSVEPQSISKTTVEKDKSSTITNSVVKLTTPVKDSIAEKPIGSLSNSSSTNLTTNSTNSSTSKTTDVITFNITVNLSNNTSDQKSFIPPSVNELVSQTTKNIAKSKYYQSTLTTTRTDHILEQNDIVTVSTSNLNFNQSSTQVTNLSGNEIATMVEHKALTTDNITTLVNDNVTNTTVTKSSLSITKDVEYIDMTKVSSSSLDLSTNVTTLVYTKTIDTTDQVKVDNLDITNSLNTTGSTNTTASINTMDNANTVNSIKKEDTSMKDMSIESTSNSSITSNALTIPSVSNLPSTLDTTEDITDQSELTIIEQEKPTAVDFISEEEFNGLDKQGNTSSNQSSNHKKTLTNHGRESGVDNKDEDFSYLYEDLENDFDDIEELDLSAVNPKYLNSLNGKTTTDNNQSNSTNQISNLDSRLNQDGKQVHTVELDLDELADLSDFETDDLEEIELDEDDLAEIRALYGDDVFLDMDESLLNDLDQNSGSVNSTDSSGDISNTIADNSENISSNLDEYVNDKVNVNLNLNTNVDHNLDTNTNLKATDLSNTSGQTVGMEQTVGLDQVTGSSVELSQAHNSTTIEASASAGSSLNTVDNTVNANLNTNLATNVSEEVYTTISSEIDTSIDSRADSTRESSLDLNVDTTATTPVTTNHLEHADLVNELGSEYIDDLSQLEDGDLVIEVQHANGSSKTIPVNNFAQVENLNTVTDQGILTGINPVNLRQYLNQNSPSSSFLADNSSYHLEEDEFESTFVANDDNVFLLKVPVHAQPQQIFEPIKHKTDGHSNVRQPTVMSAIEAQRRLANTQDLSKIVPINFGNTFTSKSYGKGSHKDSSYQGDNVVSVDYSHISDDQYFDSAPKGTEVFEFPEFDVNTLVDCIQLDLLFERRYQVMLYGKTIYLFDLNYSYLYKLQYLVPNSFEEIDDYLSPLFRLKLRHQADGLTDDGFKFKPLYYINEPQYSVDELIQIFENGDFFNVDEEEATTHSQPQTTTAQTNTVNLMDEINPSDVVLNGLTTGFGVENSLQQALQSQVYGNSTNPNVNSNLNANFNLNTQVVLPPDYITTETSAITPTPLTSAMPNAEQSSLSTPSNQANSNFDANSYVLDESELSLMFSGQHNVLVGDGQVDDFYLPQDQAPISSDEEYVIAEQDRIALDNLTTEDPDDQAIGDCIAQATQALHLTSRAKAKSDSEHRRHKFVRTSEPNTKFMYNQSESTSSDYTNAPIIFSEPTPSTSTTTPTPKPEKPKPAPVPVPLPKSLIGNGIRVGGVNKK